MKASVTIENEKTTVVLHPENDFEVDVIEKMVDTGNEVKASCHYDIVYGCTSKHSIYLTLNTEKK